MGIVKQKGTDILGIDFIWKGRRILRSARTTDRAAAKAEEAKLRARLQKEFESAELGEALPLAPMTLNEAAERYYNEKIMHEPKPGAIELQLARMVESIGPHVFLSHVAGDKWSGYLAKRRATHTKRGKLPAAGTVNHDIKLMRRMFIFARDNWDVNTGKMPKWKLLPEADGRVRWLTDDEEKRLFENLRHDYHALVRFCILAGVRAGNAISLTWDQVNFEDEVITFKMKSRKPGGRIHIVDITQKMMAVLQGEQGRHPERVFTYVAKHSRKERRKGLRQPFTQTGWAVPWRAALAAAKIKDFKFHDTRHTAATRLYQETRDQRAVMDLLGHATIQQSVRYSHAAKGALKEARERAENRVESRGIHGKKSAKKA